MNEAAVAIQRTFRAYLNRRNKLKEHGTPYEASSTMSSTIRNDPELSTQQTQKQPSSKALLKPKASKPAPPPPKNKSLQMSLGASSMFSSPKSTPSPLQSIDPFLTIDKMAIKKARQKNYLIEEDICYEFWGECYMHGMMDGDAIKLQNWENLPNRVFELR